MAKQDIKNVKLGFSGSAKLPMTIVLPMQVVTQVGGGRRLLIESRDQEVAEPVRDWLKADKRYAGLFAPELKPPKKEDTPPPKKEGDK